MYQSSKLSKTCNRKHCFFERNMRLIKSQKTGMLEQQAQNAVRQKTFYFVVKNYELDFSTNVEMSHISNLEKNRGVLH